jgi:hypothetical protein
MRCLYCRESIEDTATHVTMNGKYAHITCCVTVYRCQLEEVLQYIAEREGKLSKEPPMCEPCNQPFSRDAMIVVIPTRR